MSRFWIKATLFSILISLSAQGSEIKEAWDLLRRGKSEEAINILKKRQSDESIYLLGQIYYSKGEFNVSVNNFDKIKRKSPFYPKSVFYKAKIFESKGDLKKAKSLYKKLSTIQFASPRLRQEALVALAKSSKNPNESLNYIHEAIKIKPKSRYSNILRQHLKDKELDTISLGPRINFYTGQIGIGFDSNVPQKRDSSGTEQASSFTNFDVTFNRVLLKGTKKDLMGGIDISGRHHLSRKNADVISSDSRKFGLFVDGQTRNIFSEKLSFGFRLTRAIEFSDQTRNGKVDDLNNITSLTGIFTFSLSKIIIGTNISLTSENKDESQLDSKTNSFRVIIRPVKSNPSQFIASASIDLYRPDSTFLEENNFSLDYDQRLSIGTESLEFLVGGGIKLIEPVKQKDLRGTELSPKIRFGGNIKTKSGNMVFLNTEVERRFSKEKTIFSYKKFLVSSGLNF